MPRSQQTNERNIEEARLGERCCLCWRPIGKPTGCERLCWWCEKDRKIGETVTLERNREAGR